MDGEPFAFKIDTGALVTVVGGSVGKSKKLNLAKKSLRGPCNTPLNVLGTFTAALFHENTSIKQTIFALPDPSSGLLSRSACTRLGLIARIDSISSPNLMQEFPNLFRGLKNLQYKYSIKLKDGAIPFCLYSLRKVAHPLLPKVKQEIDRKLDQGVILPVTEPTSWCSGIVVVPKSNGVVGKSIDLTHLNKAVHREVHPISSVDESLA